MLGPAPRFISSGALEAREPVRRVRRLHLGFYNHSGARYDMRTLVIILALVTFSSCAPLPVVIPDAPHLHAKAVVFDIDGTLTPTPLKYWKARDDAANAVQWFSKEGYEIIYLSARTTLLQRDIPVWLKENSFPDGRIYVTQTAEDRRDHAKFKARILRVCRGGHPAGGRIRTSARGRCGLSAGRLERMFERMDGISRFGRKVGVVWCREGRFFNV